MINKEHSIFHEIGQVISNVEIASGIYEATIKSLNVSKVSRPGQFINILPSKKFQSIMRRPMSIASQGDDEISIIYKPIGEGTKIMMRWVEGEEVDYIGPLGNCWTGYDRYYPIIIGGGVGIAPILNLHNELLLKKIDHLLIMGARTKNEHFLDHDLENNIYMTTDDGTLGISGNVVDALSLFLSKHDNQNDNKIFSCGPPKMMESLKSFSDKFDIKCDLALETIMACGIGIWQGCTVEKNVESNLENTYRNRYALACVDGPIFSSKEIIKCG